MCKEKGPLEEALRIQRRSAGPRFGDYLAAAPFMSIFAFLRSSARCSPIFCDCNTSLRRSLISSKVGGFTLRESSSTITWYPNWVLTGVFVYKPKKNAATAWEKVG